MNAVVESMRDDCLGRPRVLLMEDEASVAQALRIILTEEGCGVDLAETGRAALNCLKERDFDLLVADLRLPDMNGMEVIKQSKKRQPETEVIVITGYASVPTAVEAMKTGAAAYLPKPFTDDHFRAAVEEALGGKWQGAPEKGERGTREQPARVIHKGDVLRAIKGAGTEKSKALSGETARPVLKEQRRAAEKDSDYAGFLQQQKLMSLGRLSASTAHEINNPLSGILNYIRLMIKILEREPVVASDNSQRFLRYLHLVEDETDRCARIVSNLLSFSRKPGLEMKEVDVPDLFERSIMLCRHKMELQSIRVNTQMERGIPRVRGDFNQLQQCLINLILNAIDAMPDGGTLVVGSSFNFRERMVEMKVTDTGCGIAKEDLPHIFEPFFTTKTEGKGLGLGLSTVFGIIDRHKGSIHVDSQPGKGTAFTIRLPVGPKEKQ